MITQVLTKAYSLDLGSFVRAVQIQTLAPSPQGTATLTVWLPCTSHRSTNPQIVSGAQTSQSHPSQELYMEKFELSGSAGCTVWSLEAVARHVMKQHCVFMYFQNLQK